MSVVANVAVNLDATSVVQRLKQIKDSAIGAGDAFKKLDGSAKAVKAAVEASGGGFAKASTVVGVFAAKVKNTENAIRAQIAALKAVQSSVQLGGALYQKAAAQIKQYEDALREANGEANNAGGGIDGIKGKIGSLVAQLALATTAFNVVKSSINAAFERGQAETRLKALTSAYGETAEATKLAAAASDKFGITQTEATKAIGDVYGRLRPLGFSLKEISGVYEGFNTLTMQAGLSSAEASSVFTQLAQSLGSGTLRGDEFNRMAESMPALLGIVSKELGVSQNELRGMAADGKITGDVVVSALQKVADKGGDLNKFLDPSTKAMNELAKQSEDAQVALGNLLKPAAIAIMEGLAKALKFTANNMKEIVQVAVFFGTFAGTLKLIALGTQAWASASKLLAAGQKAAGVAAAFLQGVMNPASLATTALALGAATAASFALGAAMDGAAEDAGQIDPEVQKAAKATTAATEEAAKLKDAYELAKVKANELAIELQTKVVSAAKAASAANQEQINGLQQINNVVGARLGVEKSLNDLQKTQLERAYGLAKTATDRYNIALKIFEVEVNAAKIAYQQALVNLTIENQKYALQEKAAVLKGYEIQAEGKLQILQAKSADEVKLKTIQLNDALAAQNKVIQATAGEGAAQKIVNEYVAQTAELQYKNAVASAAVGLESKLTSDQIGIGVNRAADLSRELTNASTSSETIRGIQVDLANKMNASGQAVKSATASAAANAQQFQMLAVDAVAVNEQLNQKVAQGAAVQGQVATAAEQSATRVVAANNIRAANAVQVDKRIVASSNLTKTAVIQSNVDAATGSQSAWAQFTIFFNTNVVKPTQMAWTNLMNALRGPVELLFGWIPGYIQFSMQMAYALAFNTFVLPWKLLWEKVLRDPITNMLDWFKGVWSDASASFVDEVIIPLQRSWDIITTFFSETAADAAANVTKAWENVAAFFTNNVTKPVQDAWDRLTTFLPKAINTAATSVKAAFTSIGDTIKSILNNVLRGVINGVNKVINEINWLIGRANSIAKRVGGVQMPILQKFSIPQFAEGGVVNRPTLAMVGEGGEPEYIIPQSKMAAASANYLNGARGGAVIPAFANGGYVGGGNAQISVTTGPVMQQGGQQYVTLADLEKAMRKTADGVYASLRTPAGRYATGTR